MSEDPIARDQDSIDREAAGWLVRGEEGALRPDEQSAFEAWRAADPRHAQTYAAMARTWNDIPALTELADLAPLAQGHDFDGETAPARRYWPRFATAGLTAVAAMLIAVPFLPPGLFRPGEQYSTEVAELRLITLPDGSSVMLGARSSIDVRFTDKERRVVLAGGEAFFDVVHEGSRPFLVAAGDSLVRDIGTKFNVNLTSGTVRIAVVEGSIAVSKTGPVPVRERVLVAGQRAEMALAVPVGAAKDASTTAASQALSILPSQAPADWRQGRLTYDNVRLADLVADVNRYYAPGVQLAPGGVGELRVTASFKTSEIPAFMSALSATLPVRAQPRGGGAFEIRDAR